jgi:hypothetical protein
MEYYIRFLYEYESNETPGLSAFADAVPGLFFF